MALKSRFHTLLMVWQSGRPMLSLIAGLAAGAALYRGGTIGLLPSVAGFIALTLVTMAAFIANDVYDKVKDSTADLPRPIATGQLPTGTAKWAYAAMLLVALALTFAAMGSTAALYLTVIIIAVLLYSPAARHAGCAKGAYSALLIISPFWFAIMVAGIHVPLPIIATLFGFSLFRELAHDATDFDRDAAADQFTLAHLMGRNTAFILGCSGMLLCVAYGVTLFTEPFALALMLASLGVQIGATVVAYHNRDNAMALTRYVFLGGVMALIRYV